MATFLSSALALAALAQATPPTSPLPRDSAAALWQRAVLDSGHPDAWLRVGRAYVRLAHEYHAHRAPPDTTWARALLDTADQAFARAAQLGAGTSRGDSARTFRVFTWGERAVLGWELGGVEAAARAWGTLPEDLRLAPVLEELGENLLRSCPRGGVLLTAHEADSHAAAYMRFARGLRPDLVIAPLAVWRSDSVWRGRVARELKLPPLSPREEGEDAWLRALAAHRPVCASMGLERAPDGRSRIRWQARPLLWVAGPDVKEDRVPPRDFVFAALRMALDEHAAWARPALELYRRAAAETPGLCEPLATFGLSAEVGCRR